MPTVIERFGCSDFVTATGEELIDAQYAGRPPLAADLRSTEVQDWLRQAYEESS